MWSETSIRADDSVRSSIVNCVCPECGGAIELSTSQFRCIGRCGKEWRAIWDNTQRNCARRQAGDNVQRVRRSRR